MIEPYVKKSLAGEDVLIYDDEDAFASMAGFEPGSHSFKLSMQMPRARLAVLKVLWRHGTIVNKSGFAMGHLAERVREFDALTFNVNAVVTAPMMQACVDRLTKGRRTMRIELIALPKSWLRMVEGSLSDEARDHPFKPIRDAVEELADAVHPLEQPVATPLAEVAPVEGELAGAVATALLAQCIEVLTTNGADMLVAKNARLTEELTQARQRLGEQTGYVDRLRRELRQAQDEVIAAKLERDGMRQRAQAAEHNLRVATSPEAGKLLEAELHKQVDKLMRQRPGTSYETPDEKREHAAS